MKRYFIAFASITTLLIIMFFLNLIVGSVEISFSEAFDILTGKIKSGTSYHIIHDIRLPRIIAAIVLGGALSLSGMLLQTFFQNPIAGPFVLGISSGAKLSVALTMIILLKNGTTISSMGMVLSAFIGAMIAMGFVMLLSLKIQNMSVLVICGILIGYICSAITDFVVTFAQDSNIVNLHNWSMGSFSGMNFEHVKIMSIIALICLVAAIFMSKPIGAYLLGENYARNMGVNIKCLRIMLILLSSILAATVTAFAGPISFVGIAVPHLIKMIFKTAKPLVLIPACFMGGSVITLFCDGIARIAFSPTEVSISSVTALFLVPVVISMMIKNRRKM